MLSKTNGFMACMRFLRDCYLHISNIGEIPSKKDFLDFFSNISLSDEDFTTDKYAPGTSGESALYRDLKSLTNL